MRDELVSYVNVMSRGQQVLHLSILNPPRLVIANGSSMLSRRIVIQ